MAGQNGDAERCRSLETLAVLAAARIIGGLVFGTRPSLRAARYRAALVTVHGCYFVADGAATSSP